jgi:hypothetical protein
VPRPVNHLMVLAAARAPAPGLALAAKVYGAAAREHNGSRLSGTWL